MGLLGYLKRKKLGDTTIGPMQKQSGILQDVVAIWVTTWMKVSRLMTDRLVTVGLGPLHLALSRAPSSNVPCRSCMSVRQENQC